MRGFLVLCCLVVGCTAQPAPTATQPVAARRQQLWAFGDTLGVSRSAALARFGRPVSVRGDTVRNFNEPEIVDSVVYVRYPAFESVYRVRAGRTSLMHVTVSAPAPGLPSQVAPGASKGSLVAWLGAPDAEDAIDEGPLLYYEVGPRDADETGPVLNIVLAGNRVRWISWVFFPERSFSSR